MVVGAEIEEADRTRSGPLERLFMLLKDASLLMYATALLEGKAKGHAFGMMSPVAVLGNDMLLEAGREVTACQWDHGWLNGAPKSPNPVKWGRSDLTRASDVSAVLRGSILATLIKYGIMLPPKGGHAEDAPWRHRHWT
jgi:hypothetical protein